MKKNIVDDVVEAYKDGDAALPKKTTTELLKAYLIETGLKPGQAKDVIAEMHKDTNKLMKHNKELEKQKEKKEKAAEVEHGTSCPRIVMKKSKKMVVEF